MEIRTQWRKGVALALGIAALGALSVGVPSERAVADDGWIGITVPSVPPRPLEQSVKPKILVDGEDRNKGVLTVGETATLQFDYRNDSNETLKFKNIYIGVALGSQSYPMLGNRGDSTCTGPVDAWTPGSIITCTSKPFVIEETATNTSSYTLSYYTNWNGLQVLATPSYNANWAMTAGIIIGKNNATISTLTPTVTTSNSSGKPSSGDKVVFHYEITNTGNGPLDIKSAIDTLGMNLACTPMTLQVGETSKCSSPEYTVTKADETAGVILDSATAVLDGEFSNTLNLTSNQVQVPTEAKTGVNAATITALDPTLTTKNTDGTVTVGDSVVFNYEVTNTGTAEENISEIRDLQKLNLTCDSTVLQPGESTTCRTAPRSVSAADLSKGSIIDNATAVLSGQFGDDVTVTSGDVRVMVVAADTPKPPTEKSPNRPSTNEIATVTKQLPTTGTDSGFGTIGAVVALGAAGLLTLGLSRRLQKR